MRIAFDDRRRGGFDEIGEVRVGKPAPQRVNGWGREDDVPDLPQPYQEDTKGLVRW
jgi:hypothetical protein